MSDEREALKDAVQPVLPALAEEIIAAIREEVDAYRRPLDGAFGANVRLGVELALGRFVAEFAGAPPRDRNRAVYVELGRGEFREGRALDALLSAYRVGARLSWRRIVDAGRDAGVAPEVLYEVGEAMFAYIDGLSAESTEGYAQAAEAAAGGRALERRRLVALLLAEPPTDEDALRAAAERAGWPLPRSLAVLATDTEDVDALAVRLGPDVLAADADAVLPGRRATAESAGSTAAPRRPDGDVVALGDPGGPAATPRPAGEDVVAPATPAPEPRPALALVPDPDGPGRRGSIAAALRGADAVLGPPVAPGDAARSAHRARLARHLQAEGALPAGLVASTDHLTALVIGRDPALAAELAAHALAPLGDLAPAARAKLTATLRAWLDAQGRIDPTAAALGVHPQTVRYRLGQLREALGDALDDPDGRLALDLALRASGRIVG